MTTTTINDLIVTLPQGWQDQSLLVLVRDAGATTQREGRSLHSTGVGNIILRRLAAAPPGLALAELAQAHADLLAAMSPDLQVVTTREITVSPERLRLAAIAHELEVSGPDGPLRQYQVFFVLGQSLYLVCGTDRPGASFACLRETLLDLVHSLSWQGSPDDETSHARTHTARPVSWPRPRPLPSCGSWLALRVANASDQDEESSRPRLPFAGGVKI